MTEMRGGGGSSGGGGLEAHGQPGGRMIVQTSTPSLISHSVTALASCEAATCSGVLPSVSAVLLLLRLRLRGREAGMSARFLEVLTGLVEAQVPFAARRCMADLRLTHLIFSRLTICLHLFMSSARM